MKLFRNKIFLIVITIIFLLFSLQFYFISSSYKRDTNSYITLISWAGKISRNTEYRPIILKVNEKQKIQNWDVVSTIWESLAVIEWWDKSITRLWANSKVLIKENFVSDDLSKINISFELLKWRTWSNVIPIMLPNSYFKQDINWVTAAVRWTVFEANYDNDYIQVHSHEVELINVSWEKRILYIWETFSIKNFSLQNIKNLVQDAFTKINQKMDEEYLKILRENFLSTFQKTNPLNIVWKFSSENKVYNMLISGEKEKLKKYISSLSEDKKQKIINNLVFLSQSINFEKGEDSYLYNLKVNTRSLIVDNSQDNNLKETLVKYSIYDLSDIFSLKNFSNEVLINTISFISNNKEYIQKQKENYEVLNQIFSIKKENLTLENIKSKLLEIDASWKNILNQSLNKILEIYKK